jgi:hypothetical protein
LNRSSLALPLSVRRISVVLALGAVGCRPAPPTRPVPLEPVIRPAPAPSVARPDPSPVTTGPSTDFGRLHVALSEAGGSFPSENVVSNEMSYLHVLDAMRRLGVRGGAYIGVGPDQNYSYIAAIRPDVAFMFDIRRENAMQHLLFKAAFAMARNRLEYLCVLTARRCPMEIEAWTARPIADIIAYLDRTPPDGAYLRETQRDVVRLIRGFGFGMDTRDSLTVIMYHAAFARDGLDVQYSSLDARPPGSMPGWRTLILATDRAGNQANYLAADSSFRFVKSMHERNLIIPVTGDVAGPIALGRVADDIRSRGLTLSALYMSNVEQYVSRDPSFPRFVENVRALPRTEKTVIIRSLFGGGYGVHPLSVPGFNSTSMLQYANVFLREYDAGRIVTYSDIVFRAFIQP